MGTNESPLHILLFPFMAQGHIVPSLQMAKLLASRAGVKISILTSPGNSIHFQTLLIHYSNIQLHLIPFPPDTGLPPGVENMSQVPGHLKPNFFAAISMFRQPFDDALTTLQPDAVITGLFHPWTVNIAAEHGIPRLAFYGSNYFSRCAGHNANLHGITQDRINNDSDDEFVVIPGLPHDIRLLRSQVQDFSKTAPFIADLLADVYEAEGKSYGLIMNSFYELEPDYADYYTNVIGRKSDTNLITVDHQFRDEDAYVKNWLDERSLGSVLFVCFGSASEFTVEQLHQLALGLEAADCPFVWAVRKGGDEVMPQGFEERVRGKGLVIKGWAPQILILNHISAGGFLTHCGWNSSLEGISAGLPFVTWPLFAEQFYNERLIVDVLKIGVAVGAKKYTWRPEERTLVEAAAVTRAVNGVMRGGEEAAAMRRKATELGEAARKAMEEGGSSCVDMSNLIQELMETRKKIK